MKFLSEDLSRFIKIGLVGVLKLVDIIKLPKIIALILTTGIVMILNYFINKLWVFKKYQ